LYQDKWQKPLVSGTNFVKINGVGSPNLKIINNVTFLQTSGFVENGNLSCFLRFGEPTPSRPKIVPLANGQNINLSYHNSIIVYIDSNNRQILIPFSLAIGLILWLVLRWLVTAWITAS
jgi:hypothetical protein